MALFVDITHWLDESGGLPVDNVRLRRHALRVARIIEYGGPLARGESRETLLECTRRPKRKPCPGLMWVAKRSDERLEAYCLVCHEVEAVVSGWQETAWAEGPMEPVRLADENA